jgi:hypothetical protein
MTQNVTVYDLFSLYFQQYTVGAQSITCAQSITHLGIFACLRPLKLLFLKLLFKNINCSIFEIGISKKNL